METKNSEESLQTLTSSLRRTNQLHLLQHWSSLNLEEQRLLMIDLESIDFEEMRSLYAEALSAERTSKYSLYSMKPLPSSLVWSLSETDECKRNRYREIGLKAIRDNQVGILLLAGGQGTRLGVSYPKGMYDIGLPSGKTLYQIQMERIRKLEELSGGDGQVMLYIMTSEATLEPTKSYLETQKYFGLNSSQVLVFEQRMIPCFDEEGRILLGTKCSVFRAPDGNGGLFSALFKNNIFEHMRERGCKYLHALCVDNVLVKIGDPDFMGYCIEEKAEVGNKVVEKVEPSEAVGVVCLVDDKFRVVEYSEISKETSEARKNIGNESKLKFNAGNICNHFFTAEFLERISQFHFPSHVARKKIPYYDGTSFIFPNISNGIKIEKFIFDAFEFSNRFVVMECRRSEEFSPLKNKSGSSSKDTPETARKDLLDLHRQYLLSSGFNLKSHHEIEISPLVSYAGENLEGLSLDLSNLTFPFVIDP